MTDTEKSSLLNALYSYKTFKKYLTSTHNQGEAVILYGGQRGAEHIRVVDLKKAIEIAEGVLQHFELQSESKAAFVRRFFFAREGWLKITREINISYGTVKNWREEALQAAEKIARKNGFI